MKTPRGRPPIDPRDPSVQLYTSVPAKQWAKLNEKAKAERMTVHDLVRRLLTVDLNKSL